MVATNFSSRIANLPGRFSGAALSRQVSQQAALKLGVFVLGKTCLIGAVWFVLATGDKFRELKKFSLPDMPQAVSHDAGHKHEKRDLAQFQNIAARNLFGREQTKSAPAPSQPAAELKLRLVGTSIGGSKTPPFAILEDTKSGGEQDTFELNETVFNQAKLVEIQPDQARLEYNGKVITLKLDDAPPAGGDNETEEDNPDNSEFSVAEAEITDALGNLPRLLSEARAVPYFRNGQSIGMRLFAIRRGSMYEKLGLKNGDILQEVNGTSVADPSQALKLFEELKSQKSIAVKLERNGESKAFNYSVR